MVGIKITFNFNSDNNILEILSDDLVSTSEKFDLKNLEFDGKDESLIVALLRAVSNYAMSMSPYELNTSEYDFEIYKYSGYLYDMAEDIDKIIRNSYVEYIYAHGVQQKMLYNPNDKNDYLALTIQDFLGENIKEEDDEYKFISKWMEYFGIGKSFKITSLAGEAYTFEIADGDGILSYLADKGMGTNQLMILFLKLATLIRKFNLGDDSQYSPTIILEEPELNMHPNYQSRLADFFYEVYNEYGVRFIVETHSEYLIRKCQVLVSQAKYKDMNDCPFKVYYFPENGQPYDMELNEQGLFDEKFGSGFFDESAKLHMLILKTGRN